MHFYPLYRRVKITIFVIVLKPGAQSSFPFGFSIMCLFQMDSHSSSPTMFISPALGDMNIFLSLSCSYLWYVLSRIQLLTTKISHICQEIHDIKRARKPKSNSLAKKITNTCMDEGRKGQKSTQEPNSNSFATEDNNDGDGSDGTYSSHSKQCHHEPSNLDIPSHHALSPPSLSPGPSGSTPTPPANLSPSPTSRIGTLTPSLPS